MSDFARQFDGIDDRLDTGLAQIKGSTNSVSAYAWIQKPIEAGSTVLGLINAFFPFQRLDFFAQLSNVGGFFLTLTFRGANGNVDFRTVVIDIGVDGRNKNLFVAAVNDVPNDRFRFFWGFTAASVVEVSIEDFTTAAAAIAFDNYDSAVNINIGALGREGGSAQNFFEGIIDTVGLVFDTVLTLEQLRQRANCGAGAETHFWPIIGESPEPGIAAIIGTTVVPGICDGVAPPLIPPRLSVKYGIWSVIADEEAGGGGGGSDGGGPPGGGGLLGEADICSQL